VLQRVTLWLLVPQRLPRLPLLALVRRRVLEYVVYGFTAQMLLVIC
jgi:hypothetical protein